MEELKLETKEPSTQKMTTLYRFDVFLGENREGKIEKVRSVGTAFVREGYNTYSVLLKTLLKDRFHLLRGTTAGGPDFVLVTREDSRTAGKKYFWNVVGTGTCLDGENRGVIELSFDLLRQGIYMTEAPISSTQVPDAYSED